MTLWCDEGIHGAADLACDGPLSALSLELAGVQVGGELGGRVAIIGEGDPTFADWSADVEPDLSVVGGFSDAELGSGYELWGAFEVGLPPAI
jgi:hypothetical protein